MVWPTEYDHPKEVFLEFLTPKINEIKSKNKKTRINVREPTYFFSSSLCLFTVQLFMDYVKCNV